ncbi:MAG: hypothetical protein KF678_10620 [Phycisphaeraceae bacterium]|nr:hypothetical protein [Phycisphaeraceae bacterium]
MRGKPSKHVPPRVVATTFAAFALSVVALLLWGRIKLVAGVPRTAYAEPRQVAAPPKPAPHPAQQGASPSSSQDHARSDLSR